MYKNKGDRSLPENYRGIGCFGIFFSLISTSLTNFLNSNKVLLENQTGFGRGNPTMDHVFTLKSLKYKIWVMDQINLFQDYTQTFQYYQFFFAYFSCDSGVRQGKKPLPTSLCYIFK